MICLNDENKKWVDGIYDKLCGKLEKSAVSHKNSIPYMTVNGNYEDMVKKNVGWWTNGFFGGTMWLMYKATGNEVFRTAAENQETLLDTALLNYDKLDHDIGFMWGLTAKAHYILTENLNARKKALFAASVLFSRLNIKSRFIKAWNGHPYSIIDCMMNIPLLYWASREIGDKRFEYAAQMHADMSIKEHIRNDGSVVHICVHNEEKDEVTETLAGQGCAVGSAWSRGQAWAVYGFALSYIHTGEKRYLDACRKVTDYFLEEVKKAGYKTVTDFKAPEKPLYFDNSAGVCAACGMLELYKITSDEKYLNGAVSILEAMEEDLIFDDSNESIVHNCMVSYSEGKQVDLIYADFFLCEAILKLKNTDFLIW